MRFLALLMTLVLFPMLFTSCSSTQETTDAQKKADIYYSHGTSKLLSKNYTEALDLMLKAEDLDPKNSSIQNNLGMAYYFKGRYKEAEEHLKASLEIDPKNSDARNNLASLFFVSKRYGEAKKEYQKVAADLIYQHQYRTYFNLALIALTERNQNEALQLLNKSIREKSDYCSAHFKIGEILREKRQLSNALESFKEASMGVCYNQPGPIFEQAITYAMMKKYTKAEEKYQEIIDRFAKTAYAPLASLELGKIRKDMSNKDQKSSVAKNSKSKIYRDLQNRQQRASDSDDDLDREMEVYETPKF